MSLPASSAIEFERGVAHHRAGQLDDAAACYRRVIAAEPSDSRALHALGVLQHQRGSSDEAVSLIGRALAVRPDYPEAHFNLATISYALGRTEEAIRHWQETMRLRPDDANALVSLSAVLCDRGEAEEAARLAERAVLLKPDFAEAQLNLANALGAMGRLGEAIEVYRRFLSMRPDSVVGHNNLGTVLKTLGRFRDAIACYREALRLDPGYLAAHSNILMCMLGRSDCGDDELLAEHKAWRTRLGPVARSAMRDAAPVRGPSRARIGFVSPDFRLHSCAYFLEPLFAYYDRAAFDFIAYSDVPRPDAVTARLRALASAWRDCAAWDDATLARRIAEDEIDILIDLTGHTGRNRLRLFATKAGPIQASWLGYPATTGIEEIDFRLTDAIADPPGAADRQGVERLVRLDGCFLAYRPSEEAPPIVVRSPGRALTFGSFNNPAKINARTVSLWADILRAVPDSRLLLKGKGLHDPAARARIAELFADAGIGGDRLTVIGWRGAVRDHFASYGEVDIGLDPTPYNGTTTTMEALWMGVPVVSLAGARHSARVGASLLRFAGLPELVAQTPDDYVSIAAALARNPERLAEYRSGLRAQLSRSPLLDGARFARSFEAALRSMMGAR